jgi:hypothetical protein
LPTVLAALGSLALLAYVPFNTFVSEAAEPDAFSMIPLYQLRVRYPDVTPRLLVLLGAVELLVVLVIIPRRFRIALPATVFCLLAIASVPVSHVVSHQARLFRRGIVGPDLRWIDTHTRGPVAYVYTGEVGWSGGAPVWANVFWNRRIRRVYDFGAAPALGPLPQTRAVVGQNGLVVTTDGRPITTRYVVAVSGANFVGTRIALAAPSPLALWRISPPLRITPSP